MATKVIVDGQRLRSWQLRVFGLLWGAYASYYLCRVNFAVAQPLILKEFPTWTNAEIGTIPSTFAVTYALGQIVNGALGDRYGTRRLMTGALLIAAVSNLLFAFTSSLGAMRWLWAINGWGQSAGWSLMVQTLADWNTSGRRGTLIGWLSTCYQAGNVLSWLLAGCLCNSMGWRAAFLLPGLFLLPVALVFFIFLRDTPAEAGFPPVRDDPGLKQAQGKGMETESAFSILAKWQSAWRIVCLTFGNRILWVLGGSCFALNAVRYSFMNWSVQYMADFHGRSIRNSVLTAIVMPLAGTFGAVLAGWASDAIFGNRRAPVCVVMLLGLAATCAALALVPQGDWQIATLLLALAGFMIYGPDMLMSGVATVDLSHPKAAAMATGFTMCLGGLGTIFSGIGFGYLKDYTHNWASVFWVLAALSLIPATLIIFIWNAGANEGQK